MFLFENAKDDKSLLRIIDKLDEFTEGNEEGNLKALINWVDRFLSKFGTKEIINLADNKLPNMSEVKSMFATNLEKILEKKEEQGIEQGIEKAKYEDVLRAIEKGYDTQIIHDITETSINRIEEIRAELKKK